MEQVSSQAQKTPFNPKTDFSKVSKGVYKPSTESVNSDTDGDVPLDFKAALEHSLKNTANNKTLHKLDSMPQTKPIHPILQSSSLPTPKETIDNNKNSASSSKNTPPLTQTVAMPTSANPAQAKKPLSQSTPTKQPLNPESNTMPNNDATPDDIALLDHLFSNLQQNQPDVQTPKKPTPDLNAMARNKEPKSQPQPNLISPSSPESTKVKIPQELNNPQTRLDSALIASSAPPIQNPQIDVEDMPKSSQPTSVNQAYGLDSKAASTMPNPSNKTMPKVADVVQKAQELQLNPKDVKFEQSPASSPKVTIQDEEAPINNTRSPASNPQLGDIKQFFDKQDEQLLRPLFYMLNTINEKDAAQRRQNKNVGKIEYVFEGKSEKIAVIHRGRDLPRNIVDSRMKNDRQEKIFERIQQDLIAGKELDLEQIRRDLESKEIQEPVLKFTNETKVGSKPLGVSTLMASSPTPDSVSPTLVASKMGQQSGDNAKKDKQGRENDKKDVKTERISTTQAPSNQNLKETVLQKDELYTQENVQQFSNASEKPTEKSQTLEVSKQEIQAKSESKIESKGTNVASVANANQGAQKIDSRNINIRETISNFAGQLSEEVKHYRPPVNRLSMELSPKELGNIELTITQQGKNLHVNVVSNPQAINLFAQNQMDLRQGLMNAGFSGVDLSFSSNDNKGGSQHSNQHNRSSQNQEYEDSPNNDLMYDSMEIVFTQYA